MWSPSVAIHISMRFGRDLIKRLQIVVVNMQPNTFDFGLPFAGFLRNLQERGEEGQNRGHSVL